MREEKDGISYELNEKTLTAEVNGGYWYEGDMIIIPETIKFNEVTYHVTSIRGQAFQYCKWLKSVVVGNSVTSIGDGAFAGCESLTSITIPDSVICIRAGAFAGCGALRQQPTQEIEINKLTYRLLMHNHLAMVVGYSGSPKTIDIPSEITYE